MLHYQACMTHYYLKPGQDACSKLNPGNQVVGSFLHSSHQVLHYGSLQPLVFSPCMHTLKTQIYTQRTHVHESVWAYTCIH